MLQEKLSALSIKCIGSDKVRSLLFQDILEEFSLERITKNKVLKFKLTYCANIVHLSFTKSYVYTSTSIMLTLLSVHIYF
jgi:hypothetical protein